MGLIPTKEQLTEREEKLSLGFEILPLVELRGTKDDCFIDYFMSLYEDDDFEKIMSSQLSYRWFSHHWLCKDESFVFEYLPKIQDSIKRIETLFFYVDRYKSIYFDYLKDIRPPQELINTLLRQ